MNAISEAPTVLIGSGDINCRVADRLEQTGLAVRMFSRHPPTSSGLDTRTGSITDAERVAAAVEGTNGIVIAIESGNHDDGPNGPEAVHHMGIQNVLAAAPAGAAIVLVSQIYITRPEAYPEMGSVIAARAKAEQALRASGHPYVIVRPSWLTTSRPEQRAIRLEQGDAGDGQISRDDVAALIVAALAHATPQGLTFEAYNAPGDPPGDLNQLFGALKPDHLT